MNVVPSLELADLPHVNRVAGFIEGAVHAVHPLDRAHVNPTAVKAQVFQVLMPAQ
jgi:hypothetical protein